MVRVVFSSVITFFSGALFLGIACISPAHADPRKNRNREYDAVIEDLIQYRTAVREGTLNNALLELTPALNTEPVPGMPAYRIEARAPLSAEGIVETTIQFTPRTGGPAFRVTIVRPQDIKSGILLERIRKLRNTFHERTNARYLEIQGYPTTSASKELGGGMLVDLGSSSYLLVQSRHELPLEKFIRFLEQLPIAQLRKGAEA